MNYENELKKWWDSRAEESLSPEELVASGTYKPSSGYNRFVNRNLEKLLASIQDHSYILDAGCGVGLYIPLLLKWFDKVEGMDLSAAVLDRVPDFIKDNPNVKLTVGSLTDMPLASSSVPALFTKSTLQCMSQNDIELAMKEIKRVLKDNGEAILHFKNDNSIGYFLTYIKKMFLLQFRSAKKLKEKFSSYSQQEDYVAGEIYFRHYKYYEELAKANGFEIVNGFSHQMYIWRYLVNRGSAKLMERTELLLKRLPIFKRILRHRGINYYLHIRKIGR